jgi:hypothetical protein
MPDTQGPETGEITNAVPKTEDLAPIKVTIIGAGPSGRGTALPETGTILQTPGAMQPNVVVEVVKPVVAVIIRFIVAYLTSLVGLISAGMTPAGGKVLYTSDFYHLLLTCASLALAGPALGAIRDMVTIFSKLESKFPLIGV